MMPSVDFFTMLAKQFDIRKSVPVVVYDCATGIWAHRAQFMLQAFGHPNVRVLDGGFNKWKTEGNPVHDHADVANVGDYNYELRPNMVFGYDDVKKAALDKTHTIVDVRPAEMFAKGSIPNAVNVVSSHFQQADGTIKSKEEIKAVFDSHNIDLGQPIVLSCNSGVKASAVYNALDHIGMTGNVVLYDGSWSEWSVKHK